MAGAMSGDMEAELNEWFDGVINVLEGLETVESVSDSFVLYLCALKPYLSIRVRRDTLALIEVDP